MVNKLVIFLSLMLLFGCENNKIKYEKHLYTRIQNDTVISKAYLIGKNWLHGCIKYIPMIVPVKDFNIADMNKHLKTNLLGLGFWSQSNSNEFDIENLKIKTFTTIDLNDKHEIKYDSVLIAPVVVMFIEQSLTSGNTNGTSNRYDNNGNVSGLYHIELNSLKLKELNYREVKFVVDSRYVKVLEIKPYNKNISSVCEYFNKCSAQN